MPAGLPVSVWCRSAPADPPSVRLQLRDADGGVLAEGPQPALELRVVPQREDDGRWFGCSARLALGDDVVTKEAEGRLTVLCKSLPWSLLAPYAVGKRVGRRGNVWGGPLPVPSPSLFCPHSHLNANSRSSPPSHSTYIFISVSIQPLTLHPPFHPNPTLPILSYPISISPHSSHLTPPVSIQPCIHPIPPIPLLPSHFLPQTPLRWTLPPAPHPSHGWRAQGKLSPVGPLVTPHPSSPAPTAVTPPSTAGPILVTRSHAGIYHCNATNSVGTRSRIVTVRVECEWGEWGALQGALGMNGVVALGGLRLVVGLGDAKYGHILLGKVGMWGEGDWLGAKRGRFGSDVG